MRKENDDLEVMDATRMTVEADFKVVEIKNEIRLKGELTHTDGMNSKGTFDKQDTSGAVPSKITMQTIAIKDGSL